MRAAVVLAAGALLTSCARPGELTVEEKQRRIDEMYAGYRTEFPAVPSVGVEALLEALEGPDAPILVDVRTDEERRVSTIPGAISKDELEARAGDLDGRPIVTYCTIGYRSGLYADELRRRGFEAANLEGSILAWTHTGRPLEHEGEPTRRVHVYGPTWDLAGDGFESVW